MFPMATACGNTMLLKPSEKDPGACMMLVELARQAGFPDGVVNVIHGAHDCKNTLGMATLLFSYSIIYYPLKIFSRQLHLR